MRITALVIFILCVNFASAIIGTANLFEVIPSDSNTQKLITNIDESVNQTYIGSPLTFGSIVTQIGDFISGLYTFIKIFFQSLFLPATMLENFGVPHNIATWATYPIYFLYLVALIQMISGRYIE